MQLSDSEWKVMNALWERFPASVREIHQAVSHETDWAYSTVKTLLTRLVDKGAVSVERHANAGIFAPLISRDAARRSALRGLLERAFGGAYSSLIHHLVDDGRLSAEERAALSKLLADDAGAERRGEPR